MSDELSAPLMSTIDITNFCNLKCAYCYAHNDKTVFMEKDKILSIVLEMQRAGVWQIVISGGEPFLHPDIMAIIKSILEHGIDLALTTNGTTLSAAQIEGLSLFQQTFSNHLSIQVSVDGPSVEINDRLRGEGVRLFHNLELMLKAGICLGIGTVLHRYSTNHLGELIQKFYPMVANFHFLSLMPSHSVAKYNDELEPSLEQMRAAYECVERARRIHPDIAISFPAPLSSVHEQLKSSICCEGCTAAVTRLDINAKGDVLACHIADGSAMGNIYGQSLIEIWRSNRARLYRHASRPLCRRFSINDQML